MFPKIVVTGLLGLSLFVVRSETAWGWEKAIWPFYTPTMVARQICTNAATQAEHNAQGSRRGRDLTEVTAHLSAIEASEIAAEPRFRAWHEIYWREMRRAAQLAWANPDASASAVREIVENDCSLRRERIRAELESTNPRR